MEWHAMTAIKLNFTDWTSAGDSVRNLQFFYYDHQDFLICEPTGSGEIGLYPWVNITNEFVTEIDVSR